MAGREKNCKWFFADQPNVQEVGPNNAMEQNFKYHPYASLVRESIQNSLDAVLDKSKPVKIKFSIGEIQGFDYPNFFELKEHIQGCLDYYSNNHNAKVIYEPMLKLFNDNLYKEHLGYIRVSDYNTKGMPYEEGETDSPFYAFVRSAGVSAKEDATAGGSYGFGKAAYYLLSPISTIIVSTCTSNFEKYFEGATSLCTHTYKGVKKVAYGYYDDKKGKPITEETDIPAKFRRIEPGTDINIIGFNLAYKEEAVDEMIVAVLQNFWLAIQKGNLVVNIDDRVVIDDTTIENLMEINFETNEDKTTKTGYYNPRPYFDAVRLSGSSKKYVFFEKDLPLLGHVCLYVSKCKGVTDKIAYFRSSQMFIYSQKTKTNYGMYGVFYCDSDKGNEVLRNLENPAHNEWKANNWRISGRANGIGRVVLREMYDFINECLNASFSLKDKIAIDIKGLEDFLYVPTSYDEDDEVIENETNQNATQGILSGEVSDNGSSYSTDILKEDSNPHYSSVNAQSTGHVMINTTTNASNESGNLHSGNGNNHRKTKTKGIQKPGNASNKRKHDENGAHGVFAKPIDIEYRAFSQVENNIVYHYVVIHSDIVAENVRLHFYSAGEDSDEEMCVIETNIGEISGNIIRNVHLQEGRIRIKIRFTDNLKHSIKMIAEDIYEV